MRFSGIIMFIPCFEKIFFAQVRQCKGHSIFECPLFLYLGKSANQQSIIIKNSHAGIARNLWFCGSGICSAVRQASLRCLCQYWRVGSSPISRTIFSLWKRYYARKRLDKATCGHISLQKSKIRIRRYFLKEKGFEPPCIKYFLSNLFTMRNQPARAVKGNRRLFLFFANWTKKIFRGMNLPSYKKF